MARVETEIAKNALDRARPDQAAGAAGVDAMLDRLLRELFHEVFAEVLEDFALSEAIREGQKTKHSSRGEVFRILQGKR